MNKPTQITLNFNKGSTFAHAPIGHIVRNYYLGGELCCNQRIYGELAILFVFVCNIIEIYFLSKPCVILN